MKEKLSQKKVDPERKKRAQKLNIALKKLFPEKPISELDYSTPWQFVVAVQLSAQSMDRLVNKVTPELFAKYPDAEAFAKASVDEIDERVKKINYHRNKSKNIIGAAKMIVEEFGGEVPKTMNELLRLPGIARKSANVILGDVYGISEGMVVDTHVKRFAIRYDLTDHTDPVKIEQDLMHLVPQKDWLSFAHRAVYYGRRLAPARKYDVSRDPLIKIYPKAAERFRV